MGLLEYAHNRIVWRGIDYYNKGKVKDFLKIDDTRYIAKVEGNADEPYMVMINTEDPMKSECNCPFANDSQTICKHMMAAYFTAFPEEVLPWQEKQEKRGSDLTEMVCHRVWHMSRNEAQEALLQMLFAGPEWQFEKFIKEYYVEEDWS